MIEARFTDDRVVLSVDDQRLTLTPDQAQEVAFLLRTTAAAVADRTQLIHFRQENDR